MGNIFKEIYQYAKDGEAYGEKFAFSLAYILLAVIIYQVIKWLVVKVTSREKMRSRLKVASIYILTLACFGLILYTWFNSMEGLAVVLGIFLIILILSFRDLVLNFTGFAYLHLRHPFAVGDRVEIDGHKGDVLEIGLFKFKLAEVGNRLSNESHTGRMIFISNQEIFRSSFANYSRDFPYLWTDIRLILSHDSCVPKAKKILEEVGKDYLFNLVHEDQSDEEKLSDLMKLGNNVELFEGNIPSTVNIEVTFTGIEFILRYLCPYREVGASKTEIWEKIVERIKEEDDLHFAVEYTKVDMVQ